MSCAMTFFHSTKSETIGVLPIADETGWLLEQAAYPRAAEKSKLEGRRGAVPNVLSDSEYSDPEHVWGDEGPVND